MRNDPRPLDNSNPIDKYKSDAARMRDEYNNDMSCLGSGYGSGKGDECPMNAAQESDKIMNPGKVDEALWAKAKKASQEAFGHEKWPFITWWYKKQGGTFQKES